jgi:chromosome segregation ATPase
MANQMLGIKGNGKPLPDPQNGPVPFRQYLYHDDFEARIFESQEAVDKALKDGWVDTPAKLKPSKAEPDTVTEISMLREQIEELNRELIEVSEAFAEQAQKLSAAEHTIADLKNVNADLENRIGETVRAKEETDRSADDLKNTITNLQKRLAEAKKAKK